MQPLDIRPVGSDEVLIVWEDGHRSLYALRSLRLHCRCARCVDEWTGEVLVRENLIAQNLALRSFEPVGRYGVKFRWNDGHDTGIYAFEHLRRLCPCDLCVPASRAQQPSA